MSLHRRRAPIVFAAGLVLGLALRLLVPAGSDRPAGGTHSPSGSAARKSSDRLVRTSPHRAPTGPESSELASVLAWLPDADAQSIADYLARWDELDPPPSRNARYWCLLRLGELDPARAFELAGSEDDPDGDFRAGLATQLAAIDPERFLAPAFLDSLDLTPFQRRDLESTVRGALLEAHPYEAFLDAKSRKLPLGGIARRLAESDPTALAGELAQLGPAYPGFHDMAGDLMRFWVEQDEDAARAWLDGIGQPHVAAAIKPAFTLASALNRDDRSEGARMIDALPPGQPRIGMLAQFFRAWGEDDFNAAASWANEHLATDERLLVLATMSEASVKSDPLHVLAVLGPHVGIAANSDSLTSGWPLEHSSSPVELPDGTRLDARDAPYRSAAGRVFHRALRNSAREHPDQARDLIDGLDLPEAIRERMRAYLPEDTP